MTLIELVKKYKGNARFDVNSVVDDNSEDVVVFMTAEAEAIKDAILNAEIIRFCVSGVHDGLPTISVLVREAADQEEETEENSEQESV